jgi:hypothetical protein
MGGLQRIGKDWIPVAAMPAAKTTRPSAVRVLLRDEALGGSVAPGGGESEADGGGAGFGEVDPGGSFAAPAAGDGLEDGGVGLDEIVLLFQGELDHGPGVIGVAQRGEDLIGDAEIGVSHVGAFFRLGEGEGEFAEGGGSHGGYAIV